MTSGGPLNAAALAAALPAAYAATQPIPFVPESVYNAAFGTTDTDTYGHVATGSAAQPTLNFARSAASVIFTTGPGTVTLITSGGAGTGSGSGYISVPQVVVSPPNIAGQRGSRRPPWQRSTPQAKSASVTLTSRRFGLYVHADRHLRADLDRCRRRRGRWWNRLSDR